MVGESRCAGLGLTLGCEGDEVALPVAAHASQSPAATPRRSPPSRLRPPPRRKRSLRLWFRKWKKRSPVSDPSQAGGYLGPRWPAGPRGRVIGY